MQKKLAINFGAVASDIKNQVEAQGYHINEKEAEYFDKLSKAITRLVFAELLTENQAEKMRIKLLKKITKKVDIGEEKNE